MGTHLTHWGAFEAESDGTSLRSVKPWSGDPDPRDILDNVASAQHHPTRVLRPAVRSGWLENGPGSGSGRGSETFVEVSWERAIELVSSELKRVYAEYGPMAVYGCSYGWASAGRFHHTQSQIHRFLNSLGGYVAGVTDYSYGASGVVLPHVIAPPVEIMAKATSWDVVSRNTELFVAFGGLSEKNSGIGPGGIGRHVARNAITDAVARGCRFIDVSPIADDTYAEAKAEWIAPVPGSDAALMLSLAFVLDAENLADSQFLDRYCVGVDKFLSYVRGDVDGAPKNPQWAEKLTSIPAERIVRLAREMAASRTMINISWSMQRQQHGEQPVWLGVTLAAMLGQIGLPGGGFQHGYGSSADVGLPLRVSSAPSFPQGRNQESSYIPVARISDMLLEPGSQIDFNGNRLTLPKIELIYWAGGNPFHHHQDLAKFRRAWSKPATVIVNEQFWTSTARHADIVLPATMTFERNDYGAGRNDPTFFPMHALTAPAGEARDDFDIFAAVAEKMGRGEAFTENRDTMGWLRHLYDGWQKRLADKGTTVVDFDTFWASEKIEIPVINTDQVLFSEFRRDPIGHPLATPSGKIEIFSSTIESFGYADCPGHPVWIEPDEWLGSAGDYPLHLIANQPKTKLHSQLDIGATSQRSKIQGREPLRMNPKDAAARGLSDGQVVLLRNDRGRCLAGLVISTAIRPGVVQLSAGAWYDPAPDDPSFCRHGNPNVLTSDRPSSRLSQATTAQHALVEVEAWSGDIPELQVLTPPVLVPEQ
ncbi:molybdopterin-dependent oxidoreductase [Arthrobacter sp. ISL-95]|uniref:molybdopterin-dependent oxidoreductase n=1 Tax=Arthrobacter sp. ISL-95 TaxID=2819116 RepID=UPI001BE9034C|nr:molybdopterin-dependent oxidoreductase [Arthrobacter sp. ISL-95]MBT2588452.1 molybdopterin-dependent oxidoreductase [Arthrobacter sp. ISL-95]